MGDSMKKKGKGLIIVLVLLIIAGAFAVYIFLNPEDNIIENIFTGNDTVKKIDNQNGIYLYEEKYKSPVKVTSSCTVTSIKYYISVINDIWYLYKDTCMGTFQLKNGNTDELKIFYDSEKEEYSLEYESNTYIKNENIRSVIPADTFKDGMHGIYLDGYKTLISETMYDGNFYDFRRSIVGIGSMMFYFSRTNNMYNIKIDSGYFNQETNSSDVYLYSSSKLEDLPDFSILNKKLVIIDKYSLNGRTNRDLKLFSYSKGMEYTLKDVFPIKVNDVELNYTTHNVFVAYDASTKSYTLLVSPNKNFCVAESKENKIAYYEFRIELDYINYSFKTPSFIRAWYEKEGCDHVNGLMEVK